MKRVISFILEFKHIFPEEMEYTFYRGYCYWFALILATRFSGEIWFNPSIVHFAAYIDGELYDIYGRIAPGVDPITGEFNEDNVEWIEWGMYQETNNQDKIESIVNSCIKKVL